MAESENKSENKFEALVNKIKGDKNIEEFRVIENDKLTEVILDGVYDEDMINYSYLVDFYNDKIENYNKINEKDKCNKNRIYEFTLVLQKKLNIQCSDNIFPICQNAQESDQETCKTKEAIKQILKDNLFEVSFKDIHEFVNRSEIDKKNGGKSKTKTRKTNKRKKTKTNKRRKTRSKTNKRKKRTRRRR